LQRNSEARRGVPTRRRVLRLAVVSALFAGMFSATLPATADGSCPTPPDVFPVHDLHSGMTATGMTVLKGTTQTPFDVEIEGVDPNGIAPGVDFILARITGPESFLKVTNGIVAGMSGSPVYIGGDLVGSTSYGFSGADQSFMGITPAQPMVDLFSYPDAPPTAAQRSRDAAIASARTIQLSPALRAAGARAAGKAKASAFPGVARQLGVPLAVSGVRERALVKFQRFITNRLHLPITVYGATGSDDAETAATTPLTPGDSLAAAISYGDVTSGAIGTATVTCGDMVVGFGHPFGWTGPSNFGLNGAKVLDVLPDPSSIFGGFKFATISGLHGTVDQDRLTGVRGIEGDLPHLIHVDSGVENLDIPGRTHDGESRVVAQDFVPIVAAMTMLAEEDVTFDRLGDGSVHAGWTIRGTGPDGDPFKLQRDNRYYSGFDATFESIFELLFEMFSLQDNRFGDVAFTSVRTSSEVTQAQLTTSIRKVLVASSLQPGLAVRNTLRVRPGGTIHVQVQLLDEGSTHTRNVFMTIQLPDNAAGSGQLFLGSGGVAFGGRGAKSFDALITSIHDAPHNYDLLGDLFLAGRRGGPVGHPDTPGLRSGPRVIHREVVKPQHQVVTGRKIIRVVVVKPANAQGARA
jgi:hypothetical protein